MYVRTDNQFGQAPSLQPLLPTSLSPRPRVLTYSTQDVIDSRISVPAQHSLVRLSKNPTTSAAAVGMLEEIKAKRLAGIFCVNWKKAAERALRFGKSWWTVIPRDEDAVLMLDPDNVSRGQPLIAFRRELSPKDCGTLKNEKRFVSSPSRLDAGLVKAFESYRFWRGIRNSGHLVKCTIVTGNGDQVLAGFQGDPLRPAIPLRNVVPPLLCAPTPLLKVRCEEPSLDRVHCKGQQLPKGLKCLTHFHWCKYMPGELAFPPAYQTMTPDNMNPGFIEPLTDTLLPDKSPGGLQQRLDELLETPSFRNVKNRIKVALVDLTGKKLFDPDFAGWNETEPPTRGASLVKIAVLYALHQLRFDLEVTAIFGSDNARKPLTSKKELIKVASDRWAIEDVPKESQPLVEELFDFPEDPPNPVKVRLKRAPQTEGLLCCIYHENCNWAADVLIHKLGFPYLASVLWQSGLYSPKRGGLWIQGPLSLRQFCEDRSCFYDGIQTQCQTVGPITRRSHPVKIEGRKFPVTFLHNVTALSAATFFTLMGQGRLPDVGTSNRMVGELNASCKFFLGNQACIGFDINQLSLSTGKCGDDLLNNKHDAVLIRREVQGKTICYVAAMLTTGIPGNNTQVKCFFGRFLTDLDKIIQSRN